MPPKRKRKADPPPPGPPPAVPEYGIRIDGDRITARWKIPPAVGLVHTLLQVQAGFDGRWLPDRHWQASPQGGRFPTTWTLTADRGPGRYGIRVRLRNGLGAGPWLGSFVDYRGCGDVG